MAEPRAYSGKSKKFIFVSYAHLDREAVLPIIGNLQLRGYNVWFDEGITPGKGWAQTIGKRIRDCKCVLAFISPRSAASPECEKELRYALDRHKAIVSVFLEPTQLGEAIADEIMAIQGIEKFNQPDESTFYIKLLEHGLFDSCHDTEEYQVIDGALVRYNGNGTSAVVSSDITQIGYNAFEGRSKLQDVRIAASVDRIGKFAFNDTPSLVKFEVDAGNGFFKAIDGVLYNKAGNYLLCYPSARPQKSYEVPQGVRNIALVSFSQAAVLENVVLPDSITYLGDRAFEACRNLTGIRLGANITRIRPYTFSRCTSLVSCALPDALESLDDGAFSGCSSLSAITLPNGLQRLGEMTFAHCGSLVSIELPAGLDVIPGYCFHECTSLVRINLDTVHSIRPYAFKNCESLSDVRFSDNLEFIGRAAFSGCTALEQLTIPGSVRTIGEYAFDRCPNLSSVTIGEGVETIAEGAFDKDFALKRVVLPASVRTVAKKAFPEGVELVRA